MPCHILLLTPLIPWHLSRSILCQGSPIASDWTTLFCFLAQNGFHVSRHNFLTKLNPKWYHLITPKVKSPGLQNVKYFLGPSPFGTPGSWWPVSLHHQCSPLLLMDGYLLHYAFDMIIEGPKIMETIYYLIPSLSQEYDLDFLRKNHLCFCTCTSLLCCLCPNNLHPSN